ncbi:uncharacterized protein LOC123677821 isoform X2 [Harmonia axyridis]|uniref:uncharacterized protein LOC123677821 isoform X2 n=1 Tax=Harmonia axyridis TaxID=115357 RepID=UPI001E275E50|nr:uncharacterized protein LOC123677821 isoform X2 [Harmonia axyridis]
MENSKNVQLHEIIKNSLATYLSYKWSADKLYLKKRRKKEQKEENQKKKKPCSLAKQRSVINLENNVFIYDAKNKTFTQLDLCDCFKNGLKYRKIDPFASNKSVKKKYELCEIPRNSPNDLQEYQSFQLMNVKDSVEHIFSNQLIKKGHWTKTINQLCPSKFDFFIQKELNKCAGKNFDVKSIKINTKQESGISSNDKVCSSAAIGYYTITTYDDALQGENPKIGKGRKTSTKQCNFIGIREETISPKKLTCKGLQCKLSSPNQHKKEKVSLTKDLGIQCVNTPIQEDKPKKGQIDNKIEEIRAQNRKGPPQRQKNLGPKKLRKKHGSLSEIFPTTECRNVGNMIQINSSAEIRRILNDDQSDSSLTLSNTGEYFRTFLSPKPLLTYYQTSSTSKDNRGDTNDEHYPKNEPIVRVVEATNDKNRKEKPKNQGVTTINEKEPICSEHCKKKQIQKVPTCDCTYEDTKHKATKDSFVLGPLPQNVCSSKCIGPCQALRKAAATLTCPGDCPCAAQKNVDLQNSQVPCVCPGPAIKQCCECNQCYDEMTNACICDLLCNLRDRIKKQTQEQNRNLDQIIEELNKQDQEIQEIRKYVEKCKKEQKKKGPCYKKNPVCSCYAATVEYDFIGGTAATNVEEIVEEKCLKDVGAGVPAEPEIIQLFGSEKTTEKKKHQYHVFEKESWKALWKNNSKVFFPNEFFKKRNIIRKKPSSSSNGPNENFQSKQNRKDKRDYKQWFSKLVCSKKDLRKNAS